MFTLHQVLRARRFVVRESVDNTIDLLINCCYFIVASLPLPLQVRVDCYSISDQRQFRDKL